MENVLSSAFLKLMRHRHLSRTRLGDAATLPLSDPSGSGRSFRARRMIWAATLKCPITRTWMMSMLKVSPPCCGGHVRPENMEIDGIA